MCFHAQLLIVALLPTRTPLAANAAVTKNVLLSALGGAYTGCVAAAVHYKRTAADTTRLDTTCTGHRACSPVMPRLRECLEQILSIRTPEPSAWIPSRARAVISVVALRNVAKRSGSCRDVVEQGIQVAPRFSQALVNAGDQACPKRSDCAGAAHRRKTR